MNLNKKGGGAVKFILAIFVLILAGGLVWWRGDVHGLYADAVEWYKETKEDFFPQETVVQKYILVTSTPVSAPTKGGTRRTDEPGKQ